MVNRPRLICIPTADGDFALAANTLLARMAVDPTVTVSPGDFADKLRLLYPSVTVRERASPVGVWPVDGPVWYVIRREFAERITGSIEIPVSPERVFHVYVEQMPVWQAAVRLQRLTAPSGLIGTEYAAYYEIFGRSVNFRLRIVDVDPPHSLRVEAEGMGVVVWYVTSFVDIPAGTRVEVGGDFVVPSRLLSTLVDPVALEHRIAKDMGRAHSALRELCVRDMAEVGVPAAAIG